MLSRQTTSYKESVRESYDLYPWEGYDAAYDHYLKSLIHIHNDHMYYYNWGCFLTKDFQPKTINDVYNNNLYSISWFYHGCYKFDTFEVAYESSLYKETQDHRMNEESLEYLEKFVFQCFFSMLQKLIIMRLVWYSRFQCTVRHLFGNRVDE